VDSTPDLASEAAFLEKLKTLGVRHYERSPEGRVVVDFGNGPQPAQAAPSRRLPPSLWGDE
jgi:hypothetical protein